VLPVTARRRILTGNNIKIKFDTFEQLMLHYDFVAFSFLELLDWIKPCVEIT
jgi:hypothetical protein